MFMFLKEVPVTNNTIHEYACLMVFNATFNNISVISWQSVLLVAETGGPGENLRPVTMTNFIT